LVPFLHKEAAMKKQIGAATVLFFLGWILAAAWQYERVIGAAPAPSPTPRVSPSR